MTYEKDSICICSTAHIDSLHKAETAATNDGKAIVENIMTRTSIRQYTDQANFCRHGKEKRFLFYVLMNYSGYTDIVKTYNEMKSAGVDVRLHTKEKMGHVYPLWPSADGKKARNEIAKIINVCL